MVAMTQNTDPSWAQVALAQDLHLENLLALKAAYRSKVESHYLVSYPDLVHDRYLSYKDKATDLREAILLGRFLKAMVNQKERKPVEAAMERMDEVVEYRREYRCNDFFLPNMGSLLFREGTNPGSEMYFCDSCLKDKYGLPYILGHLGLCNNDRIDAPNHLRAAMMVIDREACAFMKAGLVGGRLPKASYILNLTDLAPSFTGTASGTGYGTGVKAKMKSQKVTQTKVNVQGSSGSTNPASHVGIKPHLPSHYRLGPGLGTLKEASRLLSGMYPEFLENM